MFYLLYFSKKLKYIATFLSVFFCFHLFSQDTIRVMQYNILNYGVYNSYCTSTNNNINTKNSAIKTIVSYVKPDILTVNEISQWSAFHLQLMDSALNVNGINFYKKVPHTNNAGSDIVNMLYFNSNKLIFHSMAVLQSFVRDVNLYKLYYNSPANLEQGDTTFIICIQAHLKAGDTESDAVDRDTMTLRIMRSLDKMNTSNNYLIMGDFNTYTSNEKAFQNLTNNSNINIRFYDPINKPGNWNNNSYFAPYHTQSTTTISDCKSGGGLDDRFDFILISNSILNGSKKVKYIENSYKTIGNDGLHYNTNINSSPQNTSVPPNVLNALYVNSDHLPVVLDLLVTPANAIYENDLFSKLSSINIEIIDNRTLKLNFYTEHNLVCNMEIINLLGQVLLSKKLIAEKGENNFTFDLSNFKKGLYLISLSDKNNKITRKIIIN